MKSKFLKLLLVSAVSLMGFAMVSCSNSDSNDGPNNPDNQSGDQKAKYTIMFYGCAGGNLDGWLFSAIPDIVDALDVDGNQVRFAVMFNTSKDNSGYKGQNPDFIGDWATCYRFELTPETDLTKAGFRAKYRYKNASEVPLYKTATIAEYINWVKQNVPAENYIFMPMNHGGGLDLSEEITRAIGYDTNHKDDAGHLYAIGDRAIADALKQTNTHLKAIYWCGCLMGQLEVMTQLAPYCDYQFCSSHVSRAIQNLFYNIIYAINQEPDDFEQAALIDLQYHQKTYNLNFLNVADEHNPGQTHNENCDWGCWRSDKLAAINAQVKKLATLLTDNYGDETKMPQIDNATSKTYVFEYDSYFADVLDYAVNLAERLDGGQNATANQIVTDMENALTAARVYRINGINVVNSEGEKIAPKKGYFSLGISIYSYSDFLWQYYGDNYKATDFDKVTGWSKFLDMNTIRVYKGDTNPSNNSVWDLGYLED